MKIITAYTDDELYRKSYQRLRTSLKKYGLFDYLYSCVINTELEDLPSESSWGRYSTLICAPWADTWMKRAALKALVLWKAAERFPEETLVWLDADAEIVAPPSGFFLVDESFASWATGYRLKTEEALSGTMIITPYGERASVIREWYWACLDNPDIPDQKILTTHRPVRPPLTPLPTAYCYIDKIYETEHPDVTPVIYHWQASREFLKHNPNTNMKG